VRKVFFPLNWSFIESVPEAERRHEVDVDAIGAAPAGLPDGLFFKPKILI
jgi:hypothetical protein